MGERSEADAGDAAGEQLPGEADRVDDRRRQPAAGDELHLPVEEGEVEAGVVRDDDGALARKGEEVPDRCGRPGRPAEVAVLEAGDPGDDRRDGNARVDQRLERSGGQQRLDPNRADLADGRLARPEARRLEVDDDEARRLERQVVARRRREPDARPAPGQPSVARDDVLEQASREAFGSARECEERSGRLLGGHRPAPLLDELDEPVGGVEGELHPARYTNMCSYASPETPPGAARAAPGSLRSGRGLSGGPA